MKPTPEIIIDTHEADSDIASAIIDRNIGQVIVRTMETSDITINYLEHKIGIEIKRDADFNSSLYSGRLHEQIYRLTQDFTFPILIIEGWSPYVPDDVDDIDDYLEKAVGKHIKTVRTLNRKLTTYETKDQSDTIGLIEAILDDINNGKFFQLKRRVTLIDAGSYQERLLAELPNVGIVKANQILCRFKTVSKALSIECIDEWLEIPGITDSRLKEIKDVIDGTNKKTNKGD